MFSQPLVRRSQRRGYHTMSKLRVTVASEYAPFENVKLQDKTQHTVLFFFASPSKLQIYPPRAGRKSHGVALGQGRGHGGEDAGEEKEKGGYRTEDARARVCGAAGCVCMRI